MKPSTSTGASLGLMRCLLGVMLLLGDGCSWALVQKPTSEERASLRPPECTRSAVAPVVDTAFASVFLTFGVVALADYSHCTAQHQGWCGLDVGFAIAAGLLAVPFVMSSIHGYTATAECRELERGYAGCFTGVEHSCRAPDAAGASTRLALADDPDR